MKTAQSRVRPGLRRFSAMELLIALVLLFVVSPFVHGMHHGKTIEAILVTVVLFSAVFAVGAHKRTLVFTFLLASPALVGKWIQHFRPDLFPESAVFAFGICFNAFVIVHLLRFVLRAPLVNTEVLCASISAYLMMGLLWAFAYVLVAQLTPDAFVFNTSRPLNPTMEGSTAFYFSFLTLTTVGYGDITPVSPVARMLAVMEAMAGMFYLTILVARLVSMYSTSTSAKQDDG